MVIKRLTLRQATEIHWKSDDKNLCAKHPRSNVDGDDDEGFDGDFGSFFHYFTGSDDPFDVSPTLSHIS